MTAPTPTRTTIGQLVYRSLPALDIPRLAADLDAALVGSEAGPLGMVAEGDDLAILDVGASRVAVSMARGLDRKGGAAVIISVGYGLNPRGDASLARRQSVLARLIAERIAARFAPQESLWTTSDEVATPELFARLRLELAARRAEQFAARTERAHSRRGAETADVARMFQRLEASLAARRIGDVEPGSLEEIALFDLEAEEQPAPSGPMRLAAHLVDATLMVIALPVGAAMMIYGLSRGADFTNSARALALSGTAVGVLQVAGGFAGLQALLL